MPGKGRGGAAARVEMASGKPPTRKALLGRSTRYRQGQEWAPKERWELGDRAQGAHGRRAHPLGMPCIAWPLPLDPRRNPGSAEPASEEGNTGVERIYS